MAAPTTAPSWCEPIQHADTELDPMEQSAAWIDDFAGMPKYVPDWLIEATGVKVRIHLVAHEPGQVAEIGFAAAGREGVVRLALDPSGWLRVTARLEGLDVFSGYLDHPYENCEIWPVDATVDRQASQAPGAVGKARNWVSLDSRVWPTLAPLCGGTDDGVTFSVDESRPTTA